MGDGTLYAGFFFTIMHPAGLDIYKCGILSKSHAMQLGAIATAGMALFGNSMWYVGISEVLNEGFFLSAWVVHPRHGIPGHAWVSQVIYACEQRIWGKVRAVLVAVFYDQM